MHCVGVNSRFLKSLKVFLALFVLAWFLVCQRQIGGRQKRVNSFSIFYVAADTIG